MNYIIGKKVEMGQMFLSDGTVVPFTIVQAGPCVVTQCKTVAKDGYNAIQYGYGAVGKKMNKASKGHLKNAVFGKHLREMRILPPRSPGSAGEQTSLSRGETVDVSVFEKGDIVDVIGVSKGKGFQGVVKRHGFSGGKKTHGNKDQLRKSGSIGATDPQRVFKGKRMAGHMGAQRVTVKNLEIMDVEAAKNELKIKGALPGRCGALLIIQGRAEKRV